MLKINGLDKLQRRLKELSDTTSVPLSELLNPSFLRANTQFTSIEQLFESGGFKAESREDLEAIPDEQMDAHIRANSRFPDWKSLLGEAGKQWAAKKLDLGR